MTGTRIALRRLLRRPAFTTAAVCLIGGSVAVAVTVGTVAEATLGTALPYQDEDGLVALYWSRADPPIPDMSVSLLAAREMTTRSSVFSLVAATRTPLSATLYADDGPMHLTAGLAMPEAFDVLGLEPLLGRGFSDQEGENGSETRVVVLSHDAWVRLLGGRPDALGAELPINGTRWVVVGVLPPRRTLAPEQPVNIDVWFPMGVAEEVLGQEVFTQAGARQFRANARLRPGTSLAGLRGELDRIAAGFAADFPDTHQGWRLNADPLRERVLGTADAVKLLLVASILFWVTALLNLLGLLVRRAEDDGGTRLILTALGASPAHIRSRTSLDALLLALLATGLGAPLMVVSFRLLRSWNPLDLPDYVQLALGLAHLGALLAGCLLSSFAGSALADAITDSRDRRASLRSAATSRTAYAALGLQVALSTFLTVGALAAVRSLRDLESVDTGMASHGILSSRLDVPKDLLTLEEIPRRARDILDEIRAVPGVTDAFLWSPEIPSEARTYTRLRVENPGVPLDDDLVVSRYHSVSPGAASALGLEFLAGRDMTDDDRAAGRRVALVSESAARQWWGSTEAALGQRVQRTSHSEWSDVVGVVADARMSGRYGPGSGNTLDVFFMFDQDVRQTLLVFAVADPERVEVEAVLGAADVAMPELPLYDVRWMTQRLRDQERVHRSTAGFGSVYAFASLFLAVVGLAGTSLLLVTRRHREIGIKQALGATPGRLLRDLSSPGMLTISSGLLSGVLVARFCLGLVDPVILRVGPGDATSYVVAVLILGAAGAVATLAPSVGGIRRSPVAFLRSDV